MEDVLRPIYQERASHPQTLGILMIEKGRITLRRRICLMSFYLLSFGKGKNRFY